jgi:hypothetical protein
MKRILTEPIRIQTKDGRIFGYYLLDGKIKVNAGSFFRNIEVNSLRQNVRDQRAFLINNGYIKNDQLFKDYVFNNPSLAISTLMGHMDNGNEAFVTIDNIELGAFLEVDDISGYEQKIQDASVKDNIKELNGSSSKVRSIIKRDDESIIVSTNDINDDIVAIPDYSPSPKSVSTVDNRKAFKRSELKAKKSIILADFKCDLDNSHTSFISKNGKPYMEAHHLVPLSCQDEFQFSLDVDSNIVCLCPNCHRMLHYGCQINDQLKKLYVKRKKLLEISKIYIEFERLLELYD